MLWIALGGGLIYVLMQACMTGAWFRIPNAKPEPEAYPAISIIIAARNEAGNLRQNLPSILGQTYPNWEVIVVLDRCKDDSEAVLASLPNPDQRLRWIKVDSLPSPWAGKKWALQQGIAIAKSPFLACTEADCAVGPEWLCELGKQFARGNELVLGLAPYRFYPSLLNAFIRFETFYTAFQFIGLARLGLPYMGLGRNLAYSQAFFTRAGGFSDIRHRLSGDDDLLVNAHARAAYTGLMIMPQTRNYSEPKRHFREWWMQKMRHLSASPAYSWSSKLVLGSLHLAHSLHYLGLLLAWLSGLTCGAVFALYGGRLVLSWGLFWIANLRIQERALLAGFPVLDLMFFIYNLSAVPAGWMKKKPVWTK